MIGVPPLAAER